MSLVHTSDELLNRQANNATQDCLKCYTYHTGYFKTTCSKHPQIFFEKNCVFQINSKDRSFGKK